MKPLITIVIPTYNRCEKIKKALSSVKAQTFQNWEAIVVDNNSKDGTKELVNNFNDRRIKFYEIINEGLISKSRNFGIAKSEGQYLAFLDLFPVIEKKTDFKPEEKKLFAILKNAIIYPKCFL